MVDIFYTQWEGAEILLLNVALRLISCLLLWLGQHDTQSNSRLRYRYLPESLLRSSDRETGCYSMVGVGSRVRANARALEEQLACIHWDWQVGHRQSWGWYMLCRQLLRLQSIMAMTICRWKCWTEPSINEHFLIGTRQTPQRDHRVP